MRKNRKIEIEEGEEKIGVMINELREDNVGRNKVGSEMDEMEGKEKKGEKSLKKIGIGKERKEEKKRMEKGKKGKKSEINKILMKED